MIVQEKLINPLELSRDSAANPSGNSQKLESDHNESNSGVEGLKALSTEFNLQSMTETERVNFANKAVSLGFLSLQEAGALLPPAVKKEEGPNGYTIKQQAYSRSHTFNVMDELKNSIAFSKANGGSEGLEIREKLFSKLEHILNGGSIDVSA